MKKVISIIATLVLGIGCLFAQKAPKTSEERATKAAQKLTTELNLSADQTTKVKDLIKARIEAVQAVKAKYTEAQKIERRKEIKPIRQKFRTDLEAILTPEQKTKWEALKAERKAKKGERKGEGKGKKNKKEDSSSQVSKDDDDNDGVDD